MVRVGPRENFRGDMNWFQEEGDAYEESVKSSHNMPKTWLAVRPGITTPTGILIDEIKGGYQVF
jgi:hypothetical protein